jgi:hypothetical protein
MQPAQLSLLPDQCPAPPQMASAHLPQDQLTQAITLLARLIAKAAAGNAPDQNGGNDE